MNSFRSGASNQRILIVDDSKAIHDDFRKILEFQGEPAKLERLEAALFSALPSECSRRRFALTSAFQGQDALAIVIEAVRDQHPFAMAFVDIRMPPGWDGIETISRLWAADPDLQVVICSAYSDYSWEEMIEQVGQTDRLVILKKPFDVVEVLQLANALVSKWQLLQEVRFHVEELEARIRSRTGELEAANQALQAQIAERNRVEVQLRHAQKMESIGQLASRIAHEINTPIQFIGDNTRFIRDAFSQLNPVIRAQGQLWAAAREGSIDPALIQQVAAAVAVADLDYALAEIPSALGQSLEGIDRVARIVAALKEFSHPDTTEQTRLDLNHAIENTLAVCRSEWKYVAELALDLDPALPPVPVLPGEFNQVILNVVINAAHAIGDVVGTGGGSKGTISIRTHAAGEWAEISIGDTGTGIPAAARARVFDPFFTTKGVGKGTGQGLAIAHNVVVKKHGGEIRFETETGRGTVFLIRLPLAGRPSS